MDTPKAKHIPKHLLFLRDFTKNSSGVAKDSYKSLDRTLATPYFTGSAKRKKNSCGFAKSSGGGGRKKVQFWQGFACKCSKQAKQIPAPQPIGPPGTFTSSQHPVGRRLCLCPLPYFILWWIRSLRNPNGFSEGKREAIHSFSGIHPHSSPFTHMLTPHPGGN